MTGPVLVMLLFGVWHRCGRYKIQTYNQLRWTQYTLCCTTHPFLHFYINVKRRWYLELREVYELDTLLEDKIQKGKSGDI